MYKCISIIGFLAAADLSGHHWEGHCKRAAVVRGEADVSEWRQSGDGGVVAWYVGKCWSVL